MGVLHPNLSNPFRIFSWLGMKYTDPQRKLSSDLPVGGCIFVYPKLEKYVCPHQCRNALTAMKRLERKFDPPKLGMHV